MNISEKTASPESVLKKHGKTFYFAQRFLGRERGLAVARLYSFCRYVDDLADESSDQKKAEEELHRLKQDLHHRKPHHPMVADFLALADEWGIEIGDAQSLIDGVISDLGEVAIVNEQELLAYSYRVAGTVGLMMCPLLGAKEGGQPFALDLGIGMQLTNIARDVCHDARLGRRYLPAEWVNDCSPEQLCSPDSSVRPTVQKAIKKILALADSYYASGHLGLAYLPFRSRVAIAVAAVTYREIGEKLQRAGCEYWQGRVFTTKLEKVLLTMQAIGRVVGKSQSIDYAQHDPQLHQPFRNLLYQPEGED